MGKQVLNEKSKKEMEQFIMDNYTKISVAEMVKRNGYYRNLYMKIASELGVTLLTGSSVSDDRILNKIASTYKLCDNLFQLHKLTGYCQRTIMKVSNANEFDILNKLEENRISKIKKNIIFLIENSGKLSYEEIANSTGMKPYYVKKILNLLAINPKKNYIRTNE